LKNDELRAAHLGQSQFCLEAVDRDVRKPREGPAMSVLLSAANG